MSSRSLIISQARFDARITVRNGEQLLLTLVIPLALLILLSLSSFISLDVPSGSTRVEVALSGVLAVAVMSSAFTSLAISVGFDRRSGALLLLATTPLTRMSILVARSLATLAVVLVQAAFLGAVAAVLGWRPEASAVLALVFVVLGALTFGALGFALGGALRAEATLAVANGLFLLLLLAGGTVIPASVLPAPLAAVVELLPSAALGDALRTLLASAAGNIVWDAAVIIVWGIIGIVVAARTFRWD